MRYDKLIKYLEEKNIPYELNKSTKELVSFNIGGNADIVVYPSKAEHIKDIACILKNKNIKFTFLGNGTNTYFSDMGYNGVIISTKHFNEMITDGEYLTCMCGVSMTMACVCTRKHSLSGLEFAYGIPGNVGGCVYMNGSAFNKDMSNVVYKSSVLDLSTGNIIELNLNDHKYGMKHSVFMENKNYFILSATFKLNRGDREAINAQMQSNLTKRKATQPLDLPSAGSVFKRPKNAFASKLIDDAGLKGRCVGGAEVSELHAGFIVNKGNASSSDVRELIEIIKKEIVNRFGILLEEEIIYIE